MCRYHGVVKPFSMGKKKRGNQPKTKSFSLLRKSKKTLKTAQDRTEIL